MRRRAGSSLRTPPAPAARRPAAPRAARRPEARPPLAGPARPARPDGRAPGRCARERRVRRARHGARHRRRSIPTRESLSRPSRSRAARTRGRRRGALRRRHWSSCVSETQGLPQRASAAVSSASPAPVFALTATTSAPGTSSRASSTASSSVSASTASAFVIATTPCSIPSSERIARCSCVCGRAPSAASTTRRKRSIPVAPGDHVPDEALVSRDVDQRQAAAVRKVERRVAEVDRDPARALLRQPIGVLPGQRPDEPRLAVVDVAGRADRQRHAWTAATTSIRFGVGEGAAVEQRRPSRTTAITGGSWPRRAAASSSSTAQA